MHMLWLIPQYVIITVSEVMFSISGLEFSFTQVRLLFKNDYSAKGCLYEVFLYSSTVPVSFFFSFFSLHSDLGSFSLIKMNFPVGRININSHKLV